MATNQVIYDQVFRVIEAIRSEVRLNYDHGKDETNKRVCFRLKSENKAVRCEEDEWLTNPTAMSCIVSWDDKNSDLRNHARAVMESLEFTS